MPQALTSTHGPDHRGYVRSCSNCVHQTAISRLHRADGHWHRRGFSGTAGTSYSLASGARFRMLRAIIIPCDVRGAAPAGWSSSGIDVMIQAAAPVLRGDLGFVESFVDDRNIDPLAKDARSLSASARMVRLAWRDGQTPRDSRSPGHQWSATDPPRVQAGGQKCVACGSSGTSRWPLTRSRNRLHVVEHSAVRKR